LVLFIWFYLELAEHPWLRDFPNSQNFDKLLKVVRDRDNSGGGVIQ